MTGPYTKNRKCQIVSAIMFVVQTQKCQLFKTITEVRSKPSYSSTLEIQIDIGVQIIVQKGDSLKLSKLQKTSNTYAVII